MNRLATTTIVAALVALTSMPSVSHAYDALHTHPWIARQAAELLVSTYPGEYDELLEHTENLTDGATHEDDLYLDGDDDPMTLRVMRHFYHAPSADGLTYGGYPEFPNAYEWNGLDNEQNEWDWHDGLRAYQAGEYAEAYFILGHTVHLISDLTVPAHSHLDDHGPPLGDDYEGHCSSRMSSPTEGTLRAPAMGTPIPDFSNLQEAFQRTADASYYRNLYPGRLTDDGEASGVLAEMFPDIKQSFIDSEWQIPGVGKLGKGFYEAEPGFYYLRHNTVPSEMDMVDYDPSNPFERDYAAIDSEAPVVERMADELVPVAIVHSAATMKLFIDTARELPSTFDPTDPVEDPADAGGCSVGGSGNSSTLLFALFALLFFRRKQA